MLMNTYKLVLIPAVLSLFCGSRRKVMLWLWFALCVCFFLHCLINLIAFNCIAVSMLSISKEFSHFFQEIVLFNLNEPIAIKLFAMTRTFC